MLHRGNRLAQKEEPLYFRSMSETADLDQLAGRFIDLWQDQMAAMAGDPELARLLRRLIGLWGLGAGPLAGAPFAVAPDGPGPAGPGHEPGRDGHSAASAGAEAARPASGDARAVFVELGRRLDALEARLARLEAGGKVRRPRPRAKPRKRRSG